MRSDGGRVGCGWGEMIEGIGWRVGGGGGGSVHRHRCIEKSVVIMNTKILFVLALSRCIYLKISM